MKQMAQRQADSIPEAVWDTKTGEPGPKPMYLNVLQLFSGPTSLIR